MSQLISEIVEYVQEKGHGPECLVKSVDLLAICHHQPTRFEPTCYEPSFCLILQGQKDVSMGDRELALAAGSSVIVSHTLPLLARVTQASESEPFVALAMPLDLGLVRELKDEIGDIEVDEEQIRAFQTGEADTALVETMTRLFRLVHRPLDAKVVGPLIRREAHYRLLVASHGRALRQLLRPQSQADQIQRAVSVLKKDFAKPLSVPDLARVAGMSSSAFHQHFKAVTATTPLQYQKSLRLMDARQRLTAGQGSVTEIAFDVGYQSPTQFSREYSRLFGNAPRRDLPSA